MPRKIPGPKINPQKIPCRIFRALKITKHYIVNDITQKIKTVERDKKKTFAELRGRETQALPRIFRFFE